MFGGEKDFWRWLEDSDRRHEEERKRLKKRERELEEQTEAADRRFQQMQSQGPLFMGHGVGGEDDMAASAQRSETAFDQGLTTGTSKEKGNLPAVIKGHLSASLDTSFDPDDPIAKFKDKKKDSLEDDDEKLARTKKMMDEKKEWKDFIYTPEILLDWVPTTPDPTSMGAFGLDPDNGSPVPYNLNGYPDLERKLPWAKGN